MRIAIVNDLPMAVEVLKGIINSVKEYEVAWVAINGAEAVEKTKLDKPDLILMDLIMPVMDGVESTKKIMECCKCPILIVTASVRLNSEKVFAALGYGALDAVRTPQMINELDTLGRDFLIGKIESIRRKINTVEKKEKNKPLIAAKHEDKYKLSTLVAIGASTGGPKALEKIISKLPENFSAPIVIVQHVDGDFAEGLTGWLANQTKLNVKIAEKGTLLRKGNIYVAATNDHLILRPNLSLDYTEEPSNYPFRPSVDVFFNSALQNYPGKIVGVLLTGMGRDGADGLLNLKKAGMKTIAQSEETCVVFGMPKAAIELNAAEKIMNIEDIADYLISII